MKEEFQNYLNDLQATSIVMRRVDNLIEMLQEIIPTQLTGIFLSDFVTQDGTMQFDTLYLFSDSLILQARNFLQMDNFELGGYIAQIFTIEIQEQDYDFKTTSDKSRINILINMTGGPRMYQFKASKENCRYLKNIYDVYLRPNFWDLTTPGKVIIVDP